MFAADKIVAAIKDRPMTSKEIAEVTKTNIKTVWNTLKKMADEGQVEKLDNPEKPRFQFYKLAEDFKPRTGTRKLKTKAELFALVHRKLDEIEKLMARIEWAA